MSLLRKIAGSDKGFDTDLFADLDKDEDQTEKNLAPWVQSACAKASVFTLSASYQLALTLLALNTLCQP